MTLQSQILKMSQVFDGSFTDWLRMMLSITIRKNSNLFSVFHFTHIMILPLFFDHIDEVCQRNTLNLNEELLTVFGLAVKVKPGVLIGKLIDNLLELGQLFDVSFLKTNLAKFVSIVRIDPNNKPASINKINAVF